MTGVYDVLTCSAEPAAGNCAFKQQSHHEGRLEELHFNLDCGQNQSGVSILSGASWEPLYEEAVAIVIARGRLVKSIRSWDFGEKDNWKGDVGGSWLTMVAGERSPTSAGTVLELTVCNGLHQGRRCSWSRPEVAQLPNSPVTGPTSLLL